jgi:hypothetical protein
VRYHREKQRIHGQRIEGCVLAEPQTSGSQ